MIEREKAFSRNVSHELRTPLASSRAAIELALSAPAGQEENMNKFLNRAKRANADMTHLIETFLLLGRENIDEKVQNEFNLHDLVKDSFNKHNYLKKTSQIECINLIPTQCMLNTSEQYLAIVIDNLIRNAYQHTYQGSISVSINRSCIFVEDTGEGMANSHAFTKEPNNVLDKSGVGLAIVTRLCEKLEWQFSIDIEREQGTGIFIDVTNAALSD